MFVGKDGLEVVPVSWIDLRKRNMEQNNKVTSGHDSDEEIPLRKRKRLKGKAANSKDQRKQKTPTHYDIDSLYMKTSPGQIDFRIPSSTSNWNTTHLETLKVFFEDEPKPISELLDKVYENTGMFKHLTENELKHVTNQQDSLLFCTNLPDVINYASEYFQYSAKHCDSTSYEEIMKELKRVNLLQKQGQSLDQVMYFLRHILMIIQKMRSSLKALPEAGFQDLFKLFIQFGGLFASDGKLWKAEKIILKDHEITSEADIAITPVGTDLDKFDDISTLVSIVQVKNLRSRKREERQVKSRPPSRSTSDSTESDWNERPVHEIPSIYKWIGSSVLGQHGGELLIHFDKFAGNLTQKDFFYHPGMILIGTEVTFTLLVCSKKHWMEITDTDSVKKETSFISYSEPKDLLIKKDRDELLESFARLNKISSGS